MSLCTSAVLLTQVLPLEKIDATTEASPNMTGEQRGVASYGYVYVGMPKEDLEKAGYNDLLRLNYEKTGNEEWITYSDWTTSEGGDVITFYLEDKIVKGWKTTMIGVKEGIMGGEI